MQPSTRPPEKPYSLPTVALIVSLSGLCTCLGSLIGPILGIVALLRINREPGLAGRGLAIAAIVTPLILLPVQAAIAIPNFIRFQARSKQSECKANLRALFAAQRQHRDAKGQYATSLEELGFRVPRGNRYAYLLSATDFIPVDPRYSGAVAIDVPDQAAKFGVGASSDGFLAACVGNIDNDATLDVWTISSKSREGGPDGTSVPAGFPRNDVNDVIE
jgi:type II secretory pathway pseudopilin PulG